VRFKYGVIELHKIDAVELMETGLSGLLPLLPLTKDGARREIVDDMITTLVETERTESLWIGYALAAKVMSDDLSWLKWRFSMLGDFLRDSPVFQEVLEEGMEKGLRVGLQEGKLEAQRQTLLDIVQERFPELSQIAMTQVNITQDIEALRRLTVKISVAQSAKEVEQYLLTITRSDTKN
jgi:predicted transposase YdaD